MHLRPAVLRVAGALVTGALLGVAWWALAPTPEVRVVAGVLLSDEVPELYAAQDGTFALLAVLAGLVHGVWLAARPQGRAPAGVLAALGGGLAGSVLAWRLGALLGPAPVGGQSGPVPAPLELHALGVLGLWPATTALVGFAGLLLSGLLSRERWEP